MNHYFDVEVAKIYGVNAAIILQNLGHWLKRNEANETNFYDGKYWTFNSRRAYRELFPYMSERQIDTAFKKLIDDGLIITGNYNALKYDRTLWYALTQKGKCILHFDGMEEDEMQNGRGQNVKPIPDINTNIKSDNKPYKEAAKPQGPARHRYGEYNNVLLSDEELEKIKAELPNNWEQYIQDLSSYMASTGKSYKSHLATIRNWARKDQTKHRERKPEHPKQETEEDRLRREQDEKLLALIEGRA